ncbi:MAG: radical SAM protein [Perlabentimonas sp.]
MIFSPVKYNEPLFRPPAEALSAIVQATIGCSWNKCAFCEMYTTKSFMARSFSELKPEIEQLGNAYGDRVRKVFLADGDAFVLSANRLLEIIDEINRQFDKLQRISSYALPKNILSKSDEELIKLRKHGLKLLYVGIESGDDELLKLINKGETFKTTVEGVTKAQKAGIDTSIMIINGLGGKHYSKQHALNSADVINRISPKFLSTLTLSLPFGQNHFKSRFRGEYQQQSVVELLEELKLFLEHVEVDNTIFRSNHVSNNLVLEGTLSKNKNRLIEQLSQAISTTPNSLKPSAPSVL